MNNHTENIEEMASEHDAQNNEKLEEAATLEATVGQPVSSEETIEVNEESKEKESAGVILKRGREAQGLSLEIVHEATKIPMDALRAIEEGYTIRMLSPFYYKGFLKMYAGYLNIDVAEVITDYKQEELPEHIGSGVEEFEMPQWITKIFTRERKQKMVIVVGALLALFLLFKVIGLFSNRQPRPPVKKKIVKVEVSKQKPAKAVEKPRQTVRKPAPKKVAPKVKPVAVAPVVQSVKPIYVAPTTAVTKNITLTVRAKQNSWLRVATDGNIVFQSTLRLGAVETWFADDEIEISGRNINQLEFELNGKMIGTLGRKNSKAKKVVITKNGLSVKK